MTTIINTPPVKQRKVKIANILIVLLLLIIVALVFFGWAYVQRINPVSQFVPTFVQTSSPPKYLFTVGNSGNGSLNKPLAVVSDNLGRIYVADTGNREIKVFDPNGKFMYSFGKENLQIPFQMTYVNGRLWVADPALKKVQVFTTAGQLSQTFVQSPRNKDSKAKEELVPSAVAVDANEVYIADTANHAIRVFNLSGQEVRKFGYPGNDQAGLAYPNALWVNDSKVFISDTNNSRIQIFSTQGKYQKTIDAQNCKAGALTFPRGITVTPRGQILVVDVFSQMVRDFDQQGNELWNIGKLGTGNDEFNFPNGIWLDNSGKLFVTDRENNRVQVFKF